MVKNRVKISESDKYWDTYFQYTMYRYSNGLARIIRNSDWKLIYECYVESEPDEVTIGQIWTQTKHHTPKPDCI